MKERAAFLGFWQSRYPQTPPINYLFKHRLPERWTRIHSLPDAKRYAETSAEWETLLHRQRTVIADLLGDLAHVKMVINSYTPSHPFTEMRPVTFLGAFADENDTERAPVHAHLVTASLDERALNPLLRQIADEQLRAFFISTNCLIAPYDGGMDLILENAAACNAFKDKFSAWLSDRPDGL
jgi:hypothetical protein